MQLFDNVNDVLKSYKILTFFNFFDGFLSNRFSLDEDDKLSHGR